MEGAVCTISRRPLEATARAELPRKVHSLDEVGVLSLGMRVQGWGGCLRRRFVAAVLSRLVRLSYWSRVQSVVPPAFSVLLPPEPKVRPPKPSTNFPGQQGVLQGTARKHRLTAR